MVKSPLRGFGRSSVDELIEEYLIGMVYDFNMIGKDEWGVWNLNYCLIGINPNTIKKGKRFEDIIIIHEWLHAYEDLILETEKRFKESQIWWWARFHYKRDKGLATYIRNEFEDYGFQIE